MSLPKRKNYSEEELNQVFYALSDSTRRSLLKNLANGPEKITVLAEPFHMSLQAVSKHIKILENANLIKREINGRIHKCSLQTEAMEEAEKWLIASRSFWNQKLNNLNKSFEKKKSKNKK